MDSENTPQVNKGSDDNLEQLLESVKKGNAEILVIERYWDIINAYKTLRSVVKGISEMFWELHEPFNSMGSISIIGKKLSIKDTKQFIKAVKLASNFNVYPRTDGTARMDFTFYGLTKTI